MASLRHSLDSLAIATEEARAMLARRVRELGGLVLLGGTAAAAISLASWSVRDPSLSHAIEGPVRNLLGRPGAIASDLLMQLIGLASIAFLLPIAVWGWRFVTHRRLDRERLRAALWLLGVLAAAGFASCLPASRAWPLPSGLGGLAGDFMLRIPLRSGSCQVGAGWRLPPCVHPVRLHLLLLLPDSACRRGSSRMTRMRQATAFARLTASSRWAGSFTLSSACTPG